MAIPNFEVRDFSIDDLLEPSTKISFKEESRDRVQPIHLFEAQKIFQSETVTTDYVLFGGGPCISLDWCPLQSSPEYLALSCHPKNAKKNLIGSVHNGPGLVQLWSVDATSAKLSLGLIHHGRTCPALQWCPNSTGLLLTLQVDYDCLGLLAMALGNGEIQIVAVPVPSDNPCFVQLTPWISIPRSRLSGSLVSCLDWLPSEPHDMLLIGCWDGSVSIWGLPCYERREAQHLMLHQISLLALRRVVWIKPLERPGRADGSYIFFAVGHSGHLEIFRFGGPCLEQIQVYNLTRMCLMDADVSVRPMSIYVAVEDASLRQLPLQAQGFSDLCSQSIFHVYSGHNRGSINAVRCSICNSLVAYAGEDGEIGVFTKEIVGDNRYRKPHICAGAMKFDSKNRVLQIITATEYKKIGGVYIGGTVFSLNQSQPPEPDPDFYNDCEYHSIQCLGFSPNGGRATWLAAGGITGCIRLIKIAE